MEEANYSNGCIYHIFKIEGNFIPSPTTPSNILLKAQEVAL